MKIAAIKLTLAGLAVFAGAFLTPVFALAAELRGTTSCTASEKWTYTPEIDADSRIRFETLVLPQVSPMRNYGDGLALSRNGTTAPARLFGDYWRARALFTGKLDTDALDGFAAIASALPSAETAGIQVAAIECLNRIHDRDPALALPAGLRSRLSTLFSLTSVPAQRQPLYEMAVNLLDAQLAEGEGSSRSEAYQLTTVLAGSGPYESFAQGLYSASQADHPATIKALEKLFGGKPGSEHSLPASLRKHLVHARLLLARAYYSTQQFEKAAQTYQQVERASNETPEMLSELAWSYLMAQRYADAVGTATNLQVGRLRHTFAPEAPIVTAMSSNELCQFPDALRSVAVFKKEYSTSYQWLYDWNKDRKSLYNLAIAYLQKKETGVPDRIAGEWIRSNYFLAHQQEVHRLFSEKQVSERFAKSAADAQAQVVGQIKDVASDLNAGVREEKDGSLQIVSTDAIPKKRAPEFERLKASVADYNRMNDGIAAFNASQGSRDSRAESSRSRLVAEINADLSRHTEKMRKMIEEVAENSKLIEVEIYNGASHDMIWRNAHPDYGSMEKKVKVAYTRPIGHTLDWGTIDPGKSDKVEVWEDELGAFKANLHDNCSSKERYLALKGSGT